MDSLDNLCLGCMKQKKFSGTCLNCGFSLKTYEVPSHHLRPETILNGKYLIGKALGEGGFGITYIAWDLNLEIPLAIKEYFPRGLVTRNGGHTEKVSVFSGDRTKYYIRGRERFLNEAKILAKFYDTDGVVSVKEFFSENETAYIVMEYVDGRNLEKFLRENGGKIPVDGLLEMMKPVMEALIGVHSKGLIHRDISPDNIMISEDATVKLIDFGAARTVSNGEKSLSVTLKQGYAPEEQYRTRGEQGPWTDVYALCATMYRAITGVKPSASLDRMKIDDIKTPSQLGVSMDPGVEYAIMKGMAVLAKDRWSNVGELYHAIYEQRREEVNRNFSNYASPHVSPPKDDRTVFDPTPPSNHRRAEVENLYRQNRSAAASSNQSVIIGLIAVLAVLLCLGSMIVLYFTISSSDSFFAQSHQEEEEIKYEEDTQKEQEESTNAEEQSNYGSQAVGASDTVSGSEASNESMGTYNSSSYILPQSSSTYLSYSDISGLSAWEIKLAKNEIYARHGRRFANSDIQNYFDQQSWYVGTISPDNDSVIENSFNSYERENIKFLSKYE